MLTRVRREEDGASLILALVFLSLFGLAVATLLGFADTGFRTTIAVRTQGGVVYAADGAVDTAINAIRGNINLGRDPLISGVAPCPTLTVAGVNALSVDVACVGQPGSGTVSGGGSGANPNNKPAQAVLTLGTNGSEDGIYQGSNTPMTVHGNVFSSRTIRNTGQNSSFAVQGDVSALGNCTGTVTATLPPLHCANTGGGAIAGDGADPNYTAAISSVPTFRTVPSCGSGWLVTFTPGTYDDAVALSNLTNGGCSGKVFWFRPGNYYFDFRRPAVSHVWDISDTNLNVVGGTPKGWSTSAPSRPPISVPGGCKTENDATPNDGVQFIFGGDSRVSATGGSTELCANPSASSQQIAVYGLKSGTPTSSSATLKAASASSLIFTSPNNAKAIDGSSSNAALSLATTSATITLSNWNNPIPANSAILSAVLRVAHAETSPATRIASLSLTVTPGGGGTPITVSNASCSSTDRITLGNSCTAMHADSIDLTQSLQDASAFAGLSMSYTATRQSGSPTETLDGIEVDVTYSPPVLEGQSGCLTATPYPSSGCALIKTTGVHTTFIVQGTVYSPLAAIDVSMINLSTDVFARGVVSRILLFDVSPAPGYGGSLIRIPDDAGIHADRVVEFTGTIGGKLRLRAIVAYEDLGGAAPGNAVRVQKWSVFR